jgi:hypothetical protein
MNQHMNKYSTVLGVFQLDLEKAGIALGVELCA